MFQDCLADDTQTTIEMHMLTFDPNTQFPQKSQSVEEVDMACYVKLSGATVCSILNFLNPWHFLLTLVIHFQSVMQPAPKESIHFVFQ